MSKRRRISDWLLRDGPKTYPLGALQGSLSYAILSSFDFANPEREMQLIECYPGVSPADAQAAVGWPLRMAETVGETPAPSAEELRLIREELDPQGLYR